VSPPWAPPRRTTRRASSGSTSPGSGPGCPPCSSARSSRPARSTGYPTGQPRWTTPASWPRSNTAGRYPADQTRRAAPDVAGALTRSMPRTDDPLSAVTAPTAPTTPAAMATQPSHLQQIHAQLLTPTLGTDRDQSCRLGCTPTRTTSATSTRRRGPWTPSWPFAPSTCPAGAWRGDPGVWALPALPRLHRQCSPWVLW